jgi:hypothetical protein
VPGRGVGSLGEWFECDPQFDELRCSVAWGEPEQRGAEGVELGWQELQRMGRLLRGRGSDLDPARSAASVSSFLSPSVR